MRWILLGLVLLGMGCTSTPECDCGDEPSVRYSVEDVDGGYLSLYLSWEGRNAVVGTGTRQALVTSRHDSISEARVSDLRALFTPELLAIYQVDAAVHSGAAPEWRVGVDTDTGSGVFAFQGSPADPRTVRMLETLDTFTRSFLPE